MSSSNMARQSFLANSTKALVGALTVPELLTGKLSTVAAASSKTLLMVSAEVAGNFDNDQTDNGPTETVNLACYEAGITRYRQVPAVGGKGLMWDVLAPGR